MTPPLLLTVTQAAELMGFTRYTISRMIRRGELKFIPLGRIHKRVSRAEVELWISRRQIRNGVEFQKYLDGRRS